MSIARDACSTRFRGAPSAGTTLRRPLRWGAAVGAGLLLAATIPGWALGDSGDFVNGSGKAYAQVMRVGPSAGRLSLAPTFGLSLADFLDTTGRGETTVADWAAIGVAEPDVDKNTPRLRLSSNDADADKGKTQYLGQDFDTSGGGGGPMELFARATKDPFGESRVRFGSFKIPGLIDLGEGEAKTSAGVKASDELREATGTVDISSLDFGGGLVKIKGLHWEVVQKTGAEGTTPTTDGSFTIQSASVQASPLPVDVPIGNDINTALGVINAALAPTGFAMTPPDVNVTNGFVEVTPLAFEIINSPLGRQFLGPVIGAVQPIREPITNGLIENAPDLAVAVLVADLTVGVASGASQLHIEFGGVNATSEGVVYDNPFGPGNGPPDTPNLPPVITKTEKPGTPGTPGKPGTPGTPATASTPRTAGEDAAKPVEDTGELVAAAPPASPLKSFPGSRGGAAAAAGAVGIGLVGALGARDFYLMRRRRVIGVGS